MCTAVVHTSNNAQLMQTSNLNSRLKTKASQLQSENIKFRQKAWQKRLTALPTAEGNAKFLLQLFYNENDSETDLGTQRKDSIYRALRMVVINLEMEETCFALIVFISCNCIPTMFFTLVYHYKLRHRNIIVVFSEGVSLFVLIAGCWWCTYRVVSNWPAWSSDSFSWSWWCCSWQGWDEYMYQPRGKAHAEASTCLEWSSVCPWYAPTHSPVSFSIFFPVLCCSVDVLLALEICFWLS